MDDEIEDRILYQTYLSHMRLISKFAVGLPLNFSYVSHLWRLLRLYIFKPEVVFVSALMIFILMYIQSVDLWSRNVLGKIYLAWSTVVPSKVPTFGSQGGGLSESWTLKTDRVSVYAVQGRRQNMEDRFVVNENLEGTGVSLYAVFDGHGGEFAANYARDHLMKNLNDKVAEIKGLIKSGNVKKSEDLIRKSSFTEKSMQSTKQTQSNQVDRKPSLKKTSTEDGPKSGGGKITDPILLEKLASLSKNKAVTREVKPGRQAPAFVPKEASSYVEMNSTINYGKLLTDEVLLVDSLLVEAAKKTMDVAGSTALIALMEGSRLIVANVGDSRGVMCDSKGNAIPLSFDHKPQQMREQKRIEKAGGFIAFNGVWRVAGILATSRALGDYPLKDKNLVIAEPDILTYELSYHKPKFLILATDGLWDTFTNEEAIAFIKDHLSDEDFGAKSITLKSYYRGSLDNITVLIVNLSNHQWPQSS